ncbi:hypothetical protein E3U55_05995 [Filobacillus milosensis]|uniref:ABC transporter permease n=1 Tax=Filobacillus milosensis TaxID=94137 RepID=A0A4Y8IMW6_9BACI|nr:hypothetical protein [Filobacillus milosensis]TFB22785.1 hypothetical protein E3U55_05995 [Filobacillus milosensis]
MSFNQPSVSSAVKNQYLYKLKGYSSVFVALMTVQIIAMFFGVLGGVGQYGTSNGSMYLDLYYVSGDLIFAFTCIWAFVIAFTMDSKTNRQAMQVFVTNQLTRHLANGIYLVTLSIIGAITVLLGGFFIKSIVMILNGPESTFIFVGYTIGDFFIGLATTSLYLLLCSAVGYFAGKIASMGLVAKLVLIIGFLSVLFYNGLIERISEFFIMEDVFSIFILKVLVTSLVAYVMAIWLSKQLEVIK